MDAAWNDLSQTMRDTFETANNCCGFKSPQDRTGCSEERMANSVACSSKLSGRQEDLLMWLAVAVFIFAILAFLNYLVAYQLIREYKRAKREFKTRQSDKITTKYAKSIKSPRKNDEETTMKSVKVDGSKFSYLPDFFKPTPKPVISRNESDIPRSSGTMLTYEEIAAKYRKQ